ncbi:sulfotransferase [Hansschlegelia zhihuaiae]|uniref:Sulfotransferase n=1 Tax=Hansschlegelia zhihuaiae TaxID=405005 RepID=A0A4Q0MQI2_9HYPH|nr:sulfotransferase [Hansschlegelia zhihuaiae]RXF75479.1 hypothetical protein EK403_01065 [Hansschlegelia zhihuaiae]
MSEADIKETAAGGAPKPARASGKRAAARRAAGEGAKGEGGRKRAAAGKGAGGGKGASGGKRAEGGKGAGGGKKKAARLAAGLVGEAKVGAKPRRGMKKAEGQGAKAEARKEAKQTERLARKAARAEQTAAAIAAAAGLSPDVAGPGPDFFCVGLQKGGTQWLYDQLQGHADFWMPPYKEIHYFDREFPYKKISKAAQKFFAKPKKVAKSREGRGDAPVDDRGAIFFQRVAALEGRPLDIEDYARLFEPKGALLSGDVTPGYSTLDEDLIGALAKRFPEAKVCLMLREPVSRLWSQWRMVNENEPDPAQAELNFRRFKNFVDRPNVVARSYPSEIARKWSAAFGDRFRFFFLDDVVKRPDETRAELLRFLGGDPGKPSVVRPDFNRKAKVAGAERTAKMQKLLQARFAEERRRCAEMFGGPAAGWPDAPY